jgi:hypothetical protein
MFTLVRESCSWQYWKKEKERIKGEKIEDQREQNKYQRSCVMDCMHL